ncbi:MAG TPA: hypothetical protein VGP72_01870 [Planctomycetota bacterium]|jgi:hypothetical protein
MTATIQATQVARKNKTLTPLGAVKQRFGEKEGSKLRINWLFKVGKIDCFRVNYLALEKREQNASYWVEVHNGEIINVQ